jgi:hypothetical protein
MADNVFSVDDLKAALMEACGPSKETKSGKPKMEELTEQLKKLDKTIERSIVSNQQYVNELINAHNGSGQKTEKTGTKSKLFDKLDKSLYGGKDIDKKMVRGVTKALTSKSVCMNVCISTLPKAHYNKLNDIINAIRGMKVGGALGNVGGGRGATAQIANKAVAGLGGGGGAAAGGAATGGGGKAVAVGAKIGKMLATAGSGLNVVVDKLKGMDMTPEIIKGVYKDELDYMMKSRRLGYQLEGITKDRATEQAKLNIMESMPSETGVRKEVSQARMIEQRKRGLSYEEKGLKIIKAAGHASYMMADSVQEAEEIGKELTRTFVDWNLKLGLSENQVGTIGLSLGGVARATGLTGTHLAGVVKSSEQFMKNMRNAGTLTAEATKNIITFRAEAEKLGIADVADKYLQMMTSGAAFFKGESGDQALLSQIATRMGKMDELRAGTFMKSRNNMKGAAEQMPAIFQQRTGYTPEQWKAGEKGGGPDDLEKGRITTRLEMNKLDAPEKMLRLTQSFEAGSESFLQKLDKLTKQSKKGGEDGIAADKAINQMKVSEGFKYLDMLGDTMSKENVGFSTAFERVTGKFNDDEKENLQGFLGKKQGPEGLISQAADALKQAGSTVDFSSALKGATGDPEKMKKVYGDMQAEMRKLGVTEESGLDPMNKLIQQLNELNGYLKDLLAPWTAFLATIKVVINWFATIAMLGGGLLKSLSYLTDAIKWLSGIFGKGGAPAVATAAGGTKALGPVMRVLSPVMKVLGPVMKVLGPIGSAITVGMGAYKGYNEKDGVGGGGAVSGILGALTGGSKTGAQGGSWLANKLGLKGGWADTAGVVGSAAHGAGVGFGIAGPVGAAIGGAIGGLTELGKVLWTRSKDIGQWFSDVGTGIKDWIISVGESIGSWVSNAWEGIKTRISNFWQGILDIGIFWGNLIKSIVAKVYNWIAGWLGWDKMEDPSEKAAATSQEVPAFQEGGSVTGTGLAMVHAGEVVVPAVGEAGGYSIFNLSNLSKMLSEVIPVGVALGMGSGQAGSYSSRGGPIESDPFLKGMMGALDFTPMGAPIRAISSLVDAIVQQDRDIQPVALSDVHERLQNSQASIQAGPSLIRSQELERIEDYNRSQLLELKEMNKRLIQLIDAIRPGTNAILKTPTTTNNVPDKYVDTPSTSDFGYWPLGSAATDPSRGASYPAV